MSRRGDWRFLAHNLLHPLAGAAWFVGWTRLGDWLHSIGAQPAALPMPVTELWAGPAERAGYKWIFDSHRQRCPRDPWHLGRRLGRRFHCVGGRVGDVLPDLDAACVTGPVEP